MRAIRASAPGGPEVLVAVEAPEPEVRPGEVLLRVAATAVNRADLLQRMGLYPPPPGAPDILGLEASGVVDRVGDGVRDWQAGDRVCALLSGGGYAELVAVPAGQLMPVPPAVDIVPAAAIPEVFITAHDNLITRARLQPGEVVLIHGGAGGVGTAAIQVARRAGARVLVTAGSKEKLERSLELGAEAGINHRAEDFVTRVQELTGGRGADVILDVMAASYLERNLQALAPDGRLVIIGMQGGVRAEIDLNGLLRKRGTLIATMLRNRPLEQKAAIVAEFARTAMAGFADGSLRPVIDRILPLEQAAEAHRIMEAGENIGKLVLTL
ncbi:MAG: NAD(P)H-quinone oxidoreductase [Chloroflexi bacterium]|nr:MAG: NAD(P)H-quinone oxidoreductase [Chloroflexota bacterium]